MDQVNEIESWKNNNGKHGTLPSLFSLMTTKAFMKASEITDKKRVYILTRSAPGNNLGAVTWSGDIHAQWDVFETRYLPA